MFNENFLDGGHYLEWVGAFLQGNFYVFHETA